MPSIPTVPEKRVKKLGGCEWDKLTGAEPALHGELKELVDEQGLELLDKLNVGLGQKRGQREK